MFGGRSTDCRQCRRMSGNDLGLLTIGRRMQRVLTPVVAGPVCSVTGDDCSHSGKSLKAGFDHRSTFVSERVDGTGAHGRGSYRQHSPTVVSPLSGRRSLARSGEHGTGGMRASVRGPEGVGKPQHPSGCSHSDC